ncbi:MAG: AraC family transcriptional regulator [Chloroflexota bacterium]|nr:AraC family transcriptional regulator [Chloroflexota bacterium]
MVALLAELTTGEGLRPSILEDVRLGRADRGYERAPVLYETSSIYIVASGRKIGFLDSRRFVYDPNHYLVLSAPLPFECQTETGADGPMLGLSVRVVPSVVSELAIHLPTRVHPVPSETVSCVEATPLDPAMSDAAVRLLECLRSPIDAQILGPSIVREIVYRALRGPKGHLLMAMVERHGQASQINTALQWIHSHYAEPFSVARMANEVAMSVSAFHHQFKALTGSSPVQYLKSIRLHKARALIDQGAGAAVAATAVGYESASQFSREFKRFFGASPTGEAKRMRAVIADPATIDARATN